MATRIGIGGIGGRMGREVAAAALADAAFSLAGGVARLESAATARAALGPAVRVVERVDLLLPDIDVLIDFTTPDATLAHAHACMESGCAFVSGVTGLSDDHLTKLRGIGDRVPVFYARNMSVGLNALLALLPALARALDGYDIEIVETHHRHKVDAPSGTALAIAEAIVGTTGADLATQAVYGRRGVAPRAAGQIGIHAVRGGGNAGEHTVLLTDEGEEVRVSHRAYSRRTFALGALRAAAFAVQHPPGFYGMPDLLGWST